MKIAIVINTSWNIFNFRMGLIENLKAQGYEVHAVAPIDAYSEKLKMAGCDFHEFKMKSSGTNPINDLILFFRLKKIYSTIKPDCILHYTIKPNIYGTLAARTLGIPCINNVSGLGTVFLNSGLSSHIAKLLYKIAFRFPKKVFFQNNEDEELFTSLSLISSNITEILPGSGIDLSKFKFLQKTPTKPFVFLLIARLLYDKGIEEYINAARLIREENSAVRFLLLGSRDPSHKRGIPNLTIDRWIQENVIEYLGTTDDVQAVIQLADCVVLPSYREGTPRTLLEAGSCGKPLIATDVPGCNSVVKDNYNGYLCAPMDAKDLAKKMKKMLSLDSEKLRTMGSNSRLLIEDVFDEKIVIKKYIKAIRDIKYADKEDIYKGLD